MVNRDFRDARHKYEDDRIVVYWEPELCSHFARCVQGLPDVFRPKSQPWVQLWNEPDAEGADKIAEVVQRCPTGALHFERLDEGAQEVPPEPAEVRIIKDGPLAVRGAVQVPRPGGTEIIREAYRVAICRCGGSNRMPFCDGSHRGRKGFDDEHGHPAGSITGEES